MSRRPHPADLMASARIASAVRFEVHFRKSAHEVFRAECDTLAEARAEAGRMNDAHGKAGRRAGIYAIGADRSATFVPADRPDRS
jgi:hypothetical protein